MNRLLIEDHPPYRSYRPTWRFRLWRWIVASDVPLALIIAGSIFVAAVCFMAVIFMVTR